MSMLWHRELPCIPGYSSWGCIERSLDSQDSYVKTRLFSTISGSASWGGDFSPNGQLFACRGPDDPEHHFRLCLWDWQRQTLVATYKYPIRMRFYARFIDGQIVIWDRESNFLGIIGVEADFVCLLQMTECLAAVDAVAWLPERPHEILVADDRGRIYLKDLRQPGMNLVGQVQILTTDCQSITSLDRNSSRPHEFCICSSWGRKVVIGDLRSANNSTADEKMIPSQSFQFFQQRGPDTFTASYNKSGNRLLVHWENGLLYSDPGYHAVSSFHPVFSTHLDLFDAKLFGKSEDHVIIGHQSSNLSSGMDTIEIRKLPCSFHSGASSVISMKHPSNVFSSDGSLNPDRHNFGMKLYVNPHASVFAVGSSDDKVLFYRSSLA